MDDGGFEYTEEKIIPEPLYLHIFPAKEAQIHKHIQADCELYYIPGISFLLLI